MEIIETIITLLPASLVLLGYLLYYIGIFRGKLQPHPFTWILWTVFNIAFLTVQAYSPYFGVMLTLSMLSAVIALLSLRYGWKDIDTTDWLVFLLGIALTPLWFFFLDVPVVDILLKALINCLGYIPTYRKSWKDPRSEGLLVHFSVGTLTLLSGIALYTNNAYASLDDLVVSFGIGGLSTALFILLVARRWALRKAKAHAA